MTHEPAIITSSPQAAAHQAEPVSEREALQRLIDGKLLTPVFQPIVDVANQTILGYEALIRGPAGSRLARPDQLFAAAACNRQLAALEYACREAACCEFARLELDGKLFLNMTPMSFMDSQYRDGVTLGILQWLKLDPERVVFELTEKQPLEDFELLRNACEHFKGQGFAVALDDLGAGYAGLRVWSEMRPHYVKIDRHFIADIDTSAMKREFVRSMMDIAHRIGNKVIAEGIETEAELRTLVSMGVEYVQGFFIAMPAADPIRAIPAHLREAKASAMPQSRDSFQRTLRDVTISETGIAPSTPAVEVVKMFRADISLNGVPVIAGNRALGMVNRSELLNAFSLRYSYELHGKKPISEFICVRSLILDINCDLNTAGRKIAADPAQNLNVDVLVCENIGTEDEHYVGVAKVRCILAAIADEQLRVARHSNPLTGLPGNVPLYEWIDQLLCNHSEFVVAYCDINNFKPFNDAFGYSCGDDVIILLGRLLREHVDATQDFIGHVGGDDFVVVFRSGDWQRRCQALLTAFSQTIAARASQHEREYWVEDRAGERRRYGPLTLAIGCVQPDSTACSTHHQVALLLADAKRRAKELGGNRFFVSRRRAPVAQEPA